MPKVAWSFSLKLYIKLYFLIIHSGSKFFSMDSKQAMLYGGIAGVLIGVLMGRGWESGRNRDLLSGFSFGGMATYVFLKDEVQL